jgi:hypothetical protein
MSGKELNRRQKMEEKQAKKGKSNFGRNIMSPEIKTHIL